MDKDYIIHEIQRTTKANQGLPLGIDRFENETGIRGADWYGKFWIRWGDALKEAGFKANKLRGRLSDEIVLEKLALFVRELGHYPVGGEFRLKARQDNNFPSHTVFDRYGRRTALVTRLIEYCKQKSGYEDVVAACGMIVEVPARREIQQLMNSEQIVFGSVYLAKSGRHYKIGRSNSVGRREHELAIQLPDRLQMIHSFRTDDPIGIEAYWHERFKDKRLNGEWFALEPSDIAAFKRRAKFM
jgi:hypothetical protein